MIHLLPYLRYCILRTLHYLTFSGEWYPSLFSISDLSVIMFKDTFIFLSEYVSSLSFLSGNFFNCSSLTGSSRDSTRYSLTRHLFSLQFLKSSSSCCTLATHRWLLDSSCVLTEFRAIRLQIRDIIAVNCFLIEILQVIWQVFSPAQKYLNTCPNSQWIFRSKKDCITSSFSIFAA